MQAVIFVGPSLPPPYDAIEGIRFEPPARRGDLSAAVASGARWVGLVDGEFYQHAAVTPAEVRAAAKAGARLWGAASLGALRACDCPDAMTGIGSVHSRFAANQLIGEDEVAMTYDPLTYRPHAYPLVHLRAIVETFSIECSTRFITVMREIPFYARDRAEIARAANAAGLEPQLILARLDRTDFDVKRADALELIRVMSGAISRS